jgi:hypothetical protein
MLLYFYLLGATFFHARMGPALAESRRRRSFVPCRELCAEVVRRALQPPPEDTVLRQVTHGLAYAPEVWDTLAGELLVYGCDAMPQVETAPATLCCLLAPGQYLAGDAGRADFAPIQQVHFGTRDLRFGGAFYRPDHAGCNDEHDASRLLTYLESVEIGAWSEAMLQAMTEFARVDEREEELAFVRDWWPALVEMYRGAVEGNQVIVCEQV